MYVKIKQTDERLGVVEGEIYKAERYQWDPCEKVSLLARVPDGYDPCANQYFHQVEKIKDKDLPGVLCKQIADLELQLHAWPGGPTWRELVDVAASGSEGSCVFKSLVANHFELSHEEVDKLCAALNRDPETGEKIGGE